MSNQTIAHLMVAAGVAVTVSDAKAVIRQGGACLNNEKITDPDMVPSDEHYLHGQYLILRRGKKTIGGIVRDDGTCSCDSCRSGKTEDES